MNYNKNKTKKRISRSGKKTTSKLDKYSVSTAQEIASLRILSIFKNL